MKEVHGPHTSPALYPSTVHHPVSSAYACILCIILLNTYELRLREPITTLGPGSGESGEEAPSFLSFCRHGFLQKGS